MTSLTRAANASADDNLDSMKSIQHFDLLIIPMLAIYRNLTKHLQRIRSTQLFPTKQVGDRT